MASAKERRQRKTIKPITGVSNVILRLLSEMPLASVSELTARLELSGVSRASVDAHLDGLCHRDYAGHTVRGWLSTTSGRTRCCTASRSAAP